MSNIALEIWPLKIYRYWIFYLISFIFWYFYLKYIISKFGESLIPNIKNKNTFLEDLFLNVIIGVIIWWRLGHVIIYNFDWYIHHPTQIIAIWNWGMSFVWGVIWVSISLFFLKKKYKLDFQNFLTVTDLILLVVPFWIMLWRIWNFLNQELYWKIVSQDIINFLWDNLTNLLKNIKLFYIYSHIDNNLRINTNFIESFLEWFIIFIILNLIFWKKIKKGTFTPWWITGLFLILYWIFRFFAEILRYYPQNEFVWPLTKTQWIMIFFIITGTILIKTRNWKQLKY